MPLKLPFTKPRASIGFPGIVLGILLLAGLSGCATRNSAPVAAFDLGVPDAGALRPYPLAVEVRLPGWMDSEAMTYRLAFDDATRRRDYAQNRWAAAPSQLLAARLRRQLGAAGQGGCLVRVEVDLFEQTFTAPDASQARLAGRLTVLDARRRLVAGRDVAYAVPAPTPDARGGVAAQAQAADALYRDAAVLVARLDGENGAVCRDARTK